MRRTGLMAWIGSGLVLVAWLAFGLSIARAGTFDVVACNYAPEGMNHSWTWSTNDASQPSHYARYETCPYRLGGTGGRTDQEAGLSTTDALGLSSGAAPGTIAGWSIEAAEDETITGLSYERYIGHQLDPYNDWSPALRVDGKVAPSETCLDSVENGESCFVGGPPGEGIEPAVLTGLSARRLTLGIDCEAPTGNECVTGASQHQVWATLYGARVTVEDSTAPTLGSPSGSLVEATAYHHGAETVTVGATDKGGGLSRIAVLVDGAAHGEYVAPCDYTKVIPCPLSTGAETITVQTAELADGEHSLSLAAFDAAGNMSSSTTTHIVVDNHSPPPPVGLKATQVGQGAWSATWTVPTGQVAPVKEAIYEVCAAGGESPCSAPATAPPEGPLNISVPGPGTWTLVVWLVDAAGNGSRAQSAMVSLTTAPAPETTGGSTPIGPTTNGVSSGGAGSTTGSDSGRGIGVARERAIRVHAAVRHGRLRVAVAGPNGEVVRIGYSARVRGRRVCATARKAKLRHGRARTVFGLRRCTRSTTIEVAVRVGGHIAARTTLVLAHRHWHTSR